MLVYRMDAKRSLMVWLFTGAKNTDDDYARYVESFALADEAALKTGVSPGIAIAVVDEGNGVPDAAWRRRIAMASGSLKSRPIVFLVSDSSIVRGISVAINWLRPPPYEFLTTRTFEEAVAIAALRRKEPLTALQVLYEEARAEAAKAALRSA